MSHRMKLVGVVTISTLILSTTPVLGAGPASNERIERTLNRLVEDAIAQSDRRESDSPAAEALRSINKLKKELTKQEAASPERAQSLCGWTPISLCLHGRFVVAGLYENPYSAPGVLNVMGAIQITPEAGYMWFFTPANMEVPIKMVNFCPTGRYGVFAAGLTDFGVSLVVRDMLTGFQVVYINDPTNTFNTIIDQDTPWPCF